MIGDLIIGYKAFLDKIKNWRKMLRLFNLC